MKILGAKNDNRKPSFTLRTHKYYVPGNKISLPGICATLKYISMKTCYLKFTLRLAIKSGSY